jgi:hypothetical protein
MINILLQTTIEPNADDWGIERFALLQGHLASIVGDNGQPLFNVTARNRGPVGQPDPVLSRLATSDVDQLWLFAVDVGDGLTTEDCEGISDFRRRGGGLMVTRDHMDLGSSICGLAGVGAAHHFHSRNLEPDEERRRIDDPYTTNILWPNYHSGANGDFQHVHPVGELHEVLRDKQSPTGGLTYLPAHPHEGAVSAPPDDATARVILAGESIVSRQRFNIAVAFEASSEGGRAIAQSTFHHFADYNWDASLGCPSFVTERPGEGMKQQPEALISTKRYVENVARWLNRRHVTQLNW